MAETKASFLVALSQKGETPEEIAEFARVLRGMSVEPPLDAATRSREILDVVGTGGDCATTFNISTTSAILAAAGGVTVAKHGNRAVTSQTGSADVLEALGVPIDMPPHKAARMLAKVGFAFFFAPLYHPAFKHVGPARRLCAERGQRTLFNFLGPLLNPARPTAQLMGVPRPDMCEPLARVLQSLGVRRGMVVCGRADGGDGCSCSCSGAGERAKSIWMDELSTLGPTVIGEFYQEHGVHVSELKSDLFPAQAAVLADLRGGNQEGNALIARRLLAGEDRGPKRDALLLNAGAALFLAGRARTIAEGWEEAGSLIDRGVARSKLAEITSGVSS